MSSFTSLGVNKNKKGFAPKIAKRKERKSASSAASSKATEPSNALNTPAPNPTLSKQRKSSITPSPIDFSSSTKQVAQQESSKTQNVTSTTIGTSSASIVQPTSSTSTTAATAKTARPRSPSPAMKASSSLAPPALVTRPAMAKKTKPITSDPKVEPLTAEEMLINMSGSRRKRKLDATRSKVQPEPKPATATPAKPTDISDKEEQESEPTAPLPSKRRSSKVVIRPPSDSPPPPPQSSENVSSPKVMIESPDDTFENEQQPVLKVEQVPASEQLRLSALEEERQSASSDENLPWVPKISDEIRDKFQFDDDTMDYGDLLASEEDDYLDMEGEGSLQPLLGEDDELDEDYGSKPKKKARAIKPKPAAKAKSKLKSKPKGKRKLDAEEEDEDDFGETNDGSDEEHEQQKTAKPKKKKAKVTSSNKKGSKKGTAIAIGIGIGIGEPSNTSSPTPGDDDSDDEGTGSRKRQKKEKKQKVADFRLVENMKTLDDIAGDPAKISYLDRPMSMFTKDIDGVVSKTFKEMEIAREAARKKEDAKSKMTYEELEELKKREEEEERIAKERRELAKAEEEERRRQEMSGQVLAESSNAVQVRMVNGEIVLDTDTLVVERTSGDINYGNGPMEIVEENSMSRRVNSHSYGKRKQSARWNDFETEEFYNCLSQFGTDFEMIAHMIPGRTRNQIRTKFNREEKVNPEKITEYMIHKRKSIDLEKYKELIGKDLAPVPEDFHEMQLV